jgi:hypothetical protein
MPGDFAPLKLTNIPANPTEFLTVSTATTGSATTAMLETVNHRTSGQATMSRSHGCQHLLFSPFNTFAFYL